MYFTSVIVVTWTSHKKQPSKSSQKWTEWRSANPQLLPGTAGVHFATSFLYRCTSLI